MANETLQSKITIETYATDTLKTIKERIAAQLNSIPKEYENILKFILKFNVIRIDFKDLNNYFPYTNSELDM